MNLLRPLKTVPAGVLDIAFFESGPADGPPVFLMHGFPYDIHAYRHRFGLVPGDPALAAIERRLALQPAISVPCITFDGEADGVRPAAPASAHAHRFTGPRSHRVLPGVGHNMPQEMPRVFADAVLELVPVGWR